MTIDEIKNMSAQQRIQLMEEIWDSLIAENEKLLSPSWHRDILENRQKKIKSGKAKFISISDLKREAS